MQTEYARWMIKRRSRAAGLGDNICNHTVQATGITAYSMASGILKKTQQLAAKCVKPHNESLRPIERFGHAGRS
ncbi:hypothetical protein [Rosistilla oblonga]|uniref:hypothetical protein n=1 Tax=Rosistilla oblonga TaxID=2527990 RepID=UPI003A96ACFA